MIQDAFLTYQFVKRLARPFKSWPAHKTGVIDEKGNILVTKKKMTPEQKASFGSFDLIVLNMKKLMAVAPGGQSMAARLTSVLYLMHEDLDEIPTSAARGLQLTEMSEVLGDMLMVEDAPTNSAGSGQIAGIGVGPQGEPPKGKGLLFAKVKKTRRVWAKAKETK